MLTDLINVLTLNICSNWVSHHPLTCKPAVKQFIIIILKPEIITFISKGGERGDLILDYS